MNEIHMRLKALNKNSAKILLEKIGLSDKYRDLLYLKYVENLSFKEISLKDKFKNYDTNILSAMAWQARKELNNIIEQQYNLLDDEIKSIIDTLKEINI